VVVVRRYGKMYDDDRVVVCAESDGGGHDWLETLLHHDLVGSIMNIDDHRFLICEAGGSQLRTAS
jgi:hypothetical protein